MAYFPLHSNKSTNKYLLSICHGSDIVVSTAEDTALKVTDKVLPLWSLHSVTKRNDKYGWTREQSMTNSLVQSILSYKAEAFLLNEFYRDLNLFQEEKLIVCVYRFGGLYRE